MHNTRHIQGLFVVRIQVNSLLNVGQGHVGIQFIVAYANTLEVVGGRIIGVKSNDLVGTLNALGVFHDHLVKLCQLKTALDLLGVEFGTSSPSVAGYARLVAHVVRVTQNPQGIVVAAVNGEGRLGVHLGIGKVLNRHVEVRPSNEGLDVLRILAQEGRQGIKAPGFLIEACRIFACRTAAGAGEQKRQTKG